MCDLKLTPDDVADLSAIFSETIEHMEPLDLQAFTLVLAGRAREQISKEAPATLPDFERCLIFVAQGHSPSSVVEMNRTARHTGAETIREAFSGLYKKPKEIQ